jgi:hypothetical protein
LDETATGVQTPWHEPHLPADLDLLAGGHLAVEPAAVGERDHRHLKRVGSWVNVIARAREHAPAAGERPALAFDAGGRRVQNPAVANHALEA